LTLGLTLAALLLTGFIIVTWNGVTRDPVTSMGGVTVLPTRILGEVDPGDVAVFILPGGDWWEAAPPELQVMSESDRALWTQLFRSGRLP
jgi:putative intracellular protease/amidase